MGFQDDGEGKGNGHALHTTAVSITVVTSDSTWLCRSWKWFSSIRARCCTEGLSTATFLTNGLFMVVIFRF